MANTTGVVIVLIIVLILILIVGSFLIYPINLNNNTKKNTATEKDYYTFSNTVSNTKTPQNSNEKASLTNTIQSLCYNNLDVNYPCFTYKTISQVKGNGENYDIEDTRQEPCPNIKPKCPLCNQELSQTSGSGHQENLVQERVFC